MKEMDVLDECKLGFIAFIFILLCMFCCFLSASCLFAFGFLLSLLTIPLVYVVLITDWEVTNEE